MKYVIFAAGLMASSAFAQTPTPVSPIPSSTPGTGNSDYIIDLKPVVSQAMNNSLSLTQPQQVQDSTGCTLTFRTDGNVLCITGDTCSSANLPECGIFFTGQSGLTLPDVAALITATASSPGTPAASPTPGPSASPLAPTGAPGTTPGGTPYRASSNDLAAAASALRNR